eukprot:5666215-Pyramimonas_sp.AAC.1
MPSARTCIQVVYTQVCERRAYVHTTDCSSGPRPPQFSHSKSANGLVLERVRFPRVFEADPVEVTRAPLEAQKNQRT